MNKICFILLSSLCTCAANAQLSTDSIRFLLQREVNHKRSPGIIVGITSPKGHEIISYGKAFDKLDQSPDSNTIFELGSLSSLFSVCLLMEMVEQHKVSLHDPVSKFLPSGVKLPNTSSHPITLQDLAKHTSGLPRIPNNLKPGYSENPYADYTESQLYDCLSSLSESNKATVYEYSILGMALLSHSLTLKEGKSFEELLNSNCLSKLNVSSTTVSNNQQQMSLLADGHRENGRQIKHWQIPNILQGAAAIQSNVKDLLHFLDLNLGLAPSTAYPMLKAMQIKEDTTSTKNYSVSYGWSILSFNEKSILTQSGGSGGFSVSLCFDTLQKIGVVVLSNCSNSVKDMAMHILEPSIPANAYQYKWELRDTLYQTIKQKGIEAGLSLYRTLKRDESTSYSFDSQQLDFLGYKDLLGEGLLKEAIAVLKLNTGEHFLKPDVYISLAEAHLANNEKEAAIANLEKCLEINSGHKFAKELLDKIK